MAYSEGGGTEEGNTGSDKSAKKKQPQARNVAENAPTPPKKVVVTYSERHRKEEEAPSEIAPHSPSEVLASPVEAWTGGAAKVTVRGNITQPLAVNPSPAQSTPFDPAMGTVFHGVQATSSAQGKADFQETKMGAKSFVPPASRSTSKGAPPPPPPPPSAPSMQVGKTSGWILLFNVVISCCLLGLLVYLYGLNQKMAILQGQTMQDTASVTTLIEQAKRSLGQIEKGREAQRAEQVSLSELKSQIVQSQDAFLVLRGNQGWLLSEVKYLVFVAKERLEIAQDVMSAKLALQAAQQKLNALGDPRLLTLSHSLSKDIQDLDAFPVQNKQIGWMKLNQLGEQIDRLHFATLMQQSAPAIPSMVDPAWPTWKKALWYAWLEIKSMVSITRETENPIMRAYSEQEKNQIVRTLKMLCEQGQWALLEGNQSIYQASLQALLTALSQYFSEDNVQQQLKEELTALLQMKIEIPPLDLQRTLDLLSNSMKAQQGGA